MIADSRLQTADVKSTKRAAMAQRLLAFAADCMMLSGRLCRTVAGRCVFGQLMRSSASAGANYEEASAAESRADFTHKMQIVLKELRESHYWLKLADRGGLLAGISAPLHSEADELVRIVAKSVITAKAGGR